MEKDGICQGNTTTSLAAFIQDEAHQYARSHSHPLKNTLSWIHCVIYPINSMTCEKMIFLEKIRTSSRTFCLN